jgi:hypothetical protein
MLVKITFSSGWIKTLIENQESDVEIFFPYNFNPNFFYSERIIDTNALFSSIKCELNLYK